MQILRILDNGGKTIDRYTVIYDEPFDHNGNLMCLGMDEAPFHPQGFGQHCAASPDYRDGLEIGFFDLPEDCQRAVLADLA